MRVMARFLLIAVLCTLAAPAAGQEGDRLAGTWQLNVARSRFETGAPPKNQVTTLTAVPGGIREIVERVNADGSTTRWDVTVKYDGSDTPVTGDPSRDTVAFTRVDRNTVDVVNKKGGTVVSRMRIVVAEDGKSRTNTVMDASGKKTTAVLFFERR